MQLVALLIVVGLLVKMWPVIVGVVGLIVAAYWGRRVADRHVERRAAECRRVAELVARADRQHNWVMQGDPRGTYGDEYPAVTV
jgi:hypothetical protein